MTSLDNAYQLISLYATLRPSVAQETAYLGETLLVSVIPTIWLHLVLSIDLSIPATVLIGDWII
jgi:hypothetical protein